MRRRINSVLVKIRDTIADEEWTSPETQAQAPNDPVPSEKTKGAADES